MLLHEFGDTMVFILIIMYLCRCETPKSLRTSRRPVLSGLCLRTRWPLTVVSSPLTVVWSPCGHTAPSLTRVPLAAPADLNDASRWRWMAAGAGWSPAPPSSCTSSSVA